MKFGWYWLWCIMMSSLWYLSHLLFWSKWARQRQMTLVILVGQKWNVLSCIKVVKSTSIIERKIIIDIYFRVMNNILLIFINLMCEFVIVNLFIHIYRIIREVNDIFSIMRNWWIVSDWVSLNGKVWNYCAPLLQILLSIIWSLLPFPKQRCLTFIFFKHQ